jgi:hypothetical protein
MTRRFVDLEQDDQNGHIIVDKNPSVHVEVEIVDADGLIADISACEEVLLNLTCDDGDLGINILNNVLYIPGLTHILLS